MLRTWILLSLLTLLFSCGLNRSAEYTFQVDRSQRTLRFYHVGTPERASFEISLLSNAGNLDTAAEFCLDAFSKFKEYSKTYDAVSGTVRIGPAADLYQVYFQLAAFSMPEVKNDLIRYGLIQSSWRKWVRESETKNDTVSIALRDWKYNVFLAEDFNDLFRSFNAGQSDLDQVYPYAVSYILKEILFISLQEMLARPARYYNPREYGSIFCQMVTLPEAVAFTEYLTAKYGKDRVLKMAKTSFSTNSWKSLTGEFFHDTEGDFTAGLEKKEFQGIYQDARFREKLDELLKTYNKMTKSTLFRK
jgi:hypothetical protein